MATERGRPFALATAALLAITVLWGATFVVVKKAIETVPPIEFLALRFGLATLVLLAISLRHLRHLKKAMVPGLVAGSMLGVGYLFQTLGLRHTTATKSGLITGLMVVLAPLADTLMTRRTPSWTGWMAVALATGGLFALSGMRLDGLNIGDSMTLITAAAFGIHIAILGKYSLNHHPLVLSVMQMGAATTMFIPLSIATEELVLPTDPLVWTSIAILGIGASAVAFLVQTWAQRILSPTRTAVTLTMEPVFAGLTGYLVLNERLGPIGLLGAACIFTAMLIVSLSASNASHELEQIHS